MEGKNCVVVLGPTASGKTHLAVRLADRLGGKILSVDSRQIYHGLDLGAGKDLSEYRGEKGNPIPYRLIDLVDLDDEYSVFDFQIDFYRCFQETLAENRIPIAVGGTGLYLEAVLDGYRMVRVDTNPRLREELNTLTQDELESRLRSSKSNFHNITDFASRERIIRAIEIAEAQSLLPIPEAPTIDSLILGIEWERSVLRNRIDQRLRQRLEAGMIEEVETLHARGISWERLESLGLEYRYLAEYLQGKIKTENDLYQKLRAAINQFSKRQMTWFRRMERKGTIIHWIPGGDLDRAFELVERVTWGQDSV